MTSGTGEYRLDDVDRRILYALMDDARNTTAAAIAETANVSGATVRNRIANLESAGIVRGYTASVAFEDAGGLLTNLYHCNVPVTERESLAHAALGVPGVVNVRSLMTGRENLHVLAVGEDTAALQRVARSLSRLGIEVEDEDLVEDRLNSPYAAFDPDGASRKGTVNDVIELSGDSRIVELTLDANAPVAGRTLETAAGDGDLPEDVLVIAIERDDREFTPHGDTVLRPDDILTVLARTDARVDALDAFRAPEDAEAPSR